jgi:hypothetical protein
LEAPSAALRNFNLNPKANWIAEKEKQQIKDVREPFSVKEGRLGRVT